MLEGYEQRRQAQEDLAILWHALPVFQTQLGNKAPTYERLTAYRKTEKETPDNVVEHWRKVLDEVQNATEH